MARKGTTGMEVRGDGVAVITISNPPVNALSLDVIASLQRNYGEALRRNDVKAIVLTGAKGRFSGGFDINAFQNKPTGQYFVQPLFYTRGGVMFWAGSLGAKYVFNRLEAWSKDYGEFFRPCEYLAARARQGASLVATVDGAKSRL